MTDVTGTGSVWWQGKHPAVALTTVADDHETYDVVVAGAGLTGLVTALELARAGRSVLVVEARHVGAVTTGHTTGKLSALQGTMLSRLSRTAEREQLAAYVTSTRVAMDWAARFCAEHDVPVERRPAVTYAAADDEIPAVRAEHEAATALGLPVSWQDRPDLPVPASAATVLQDQLQLDPVALLLALEQAVRGAGGALVTGHRVQRVRQRRDGVHVETSGGATLHGRALVLATGTPVVDRRAHFSRLTAQRSYLSAFEVADPPGVMALSGGQPGRSFRGAEVDGRSLLLVGGEGHVTGRTRSERDRIDALRDWTGEHFPGAREVATWSAQDYTSLDGLPVVGDLGGPSPAVHVATGFHKWGLTSGVAAAVTLAGRITGDPPPWADRLYQRPPRPRDVGAFLRTQLGVGAGGATAAARTAVGRPERPSRPAGCAVAPVCTHLGGVLKWNDAEDTWDCPLHGSRFAADGEVLEGPATRRLLHRRTSS